MKLIARTSVHTPVSLVCPVSAGLVVLDGNVDWHCVCRCSLLCSRFLSPSLVHDVSSSSFFFFKGVWVGFLSF